MLSGCFRRLGPESNPVGSAMTSAGGQDLEHVPNSDPPCERIISDDPLYAPCEGVAEEINIVGLIRWFARGL